MKVRLMNDVILPDDDPILRFHDLILLPAGINQGSSYPEFPTFQPSGG
jgi:hypothetical protein